jgi:hypothetical protein
VHETLGSFCIYSPSQTHFSTFVKKSSTEVSQSVNLEKDAYEHLGNKDARE